MATLMTQVGGLALQNPVMAASGTFGFGREMAQYQDLAKLGGICSKGLTLLPRLGNPAPRVAESEAGMLNSVGLQNPGLASFIDEELPFMQTLGCKTIANIAGHSNEEYLDMIRMLDKTDIDAIEMNLSCPNVKEGCMLIGSNAKMIEQLVKSARALTQKPLWAKLTPNVTSIGDMAKAAQAGGADGIVLINTLMGMVIDRSSRRPVLRNNTGGLSGPAIKPVAIRMVSEVYRSVEIPIVGVGGIMTGSDAIEFLIAGASAVQVGTANLVKPTACQDIISEISRIAEQDGVKSVTDYVGTLELWA